METSLTVDAVRGLATAVHRVDNLAAPISSGSFLTAGMVIAPCSMNTLAGLAQGLSHNLILRAADVTLKERRPLIVLARETPLSKIHLRNMLALADAGATIMPPAPAFYTQPQTVDELIEDTVGRALDQLGIRVPGARRWREHDADVSDPTPSVIETPGQVYI